MKYETKLVVKSVIGSLTKRMLGTHVSALLVDTDLGVFAVDPEDFGVGRKLRVDGAWGVDEIERISSHTGPDANVLVVGAHVGTLAIPLARMSKSVVAIEANPRTYRLLRRNLLLNEVRNCVALNIAASDKEGEISFLLSRSNSGGSKRTPKHPKFIYYHDRPEEILVPGNALDHVLEAKQFDVVVMDIEGSEYFALKGMQAILGGCKLLVVEFVPHHLRNVASVSVAEFLAEIEPHFEFLTIPTTGQRIPRSQFLPYLSAMFDHDQVDDGIMFEKATPTS